jgi:hypothetical protein
MFTARRIARVMGDRSDQRAAEVNSTDNARSTK